MSKQEENSLIQFLQDLPAKIAIALKGETKEVEVKFGEVKTMDGNTTIAYEGEMPEVGMQVWVWAEDGTKVPLPVGDYELEDGRILVIAEEGIIAEIKEPTPENGAVEPEGQSSAQMTAKESDATARAIENAIKSIMIKYSEEAKAENELLKAELKAVNEKLVELASQPASKPVKSAPQMTEPKNAKERLLQTIQNQH